MNFKSKTISIVVLILLFVSGPIYSQGLFKNNTKTTQESAATSNGGIFRGGPVDPPDQPPGDENTPVGEGLAILSLLSGGFFMLKRRNSEK